VTNAPGEEGDLDARFVATVPSFGMGVDRDGHAWTFSPADGNASRIDLETEATDVRLGPDDCGGSSCLYDPWIHGDPAGLARSRLRAPGAWSTVIEGCTSGPTDWNRLEISADAPDGSGIAVDVRTAARLQDLGRAAWLELGILAADGPVFDLDGRGLADGELLEVRTTLRGRDDAGDGPVLRGAELRWSCQEVVQ
jgi:hypothetical protein